MQKAKKVRQKFLNGNPPLEKKIVFGMGVCRVCAIITLNPYVSEYFYYLC